MFALEKKCPGICFVIVLNECIMYVCVYVARRRNGERKVVRRCQEESKEEEKKSGEKRSFLTLEEAGLVEISGLSTHERFLCRLTVHFFTL